jgi:signal recognition particle subunit SRP54
MMGMPGMGRKATKSPKNKRKGTKGGSSRRTAPPAVGGMPRMPALPPGLDPSALDQDTQGLPPGFKLPKLDFNKLTRRDDK